MERARTPEHPRGASGPQDGWPPDLSAEDEAGDAPDEALMFETVIVPARLDAIVARRVAIASNRDGVSIADLLGRAAAAYDWRVKDEATSEPGDRR